MKSQIFFSLLLTSGLSTYGQMDQYDYRRELIDVSDEWHKIELPNEIFANVSQDISDIRVFGITPGLDTIEAPYLLRMTKEEASRKEILFNLVNSSHNDNGYYFTFEIPTNEPINQINLEFKQHNFDWQLKLEGSQNQQEWFTVIEDYRILSIKNDMTDFQFTKMTFPSSKYRFFRLLIDSKVKPDLISAKISQYDALNEIFRDYLIRVSTTIENKRLKQTEIEIDLEMPVPVSHIKLEIQNGFDYYRPITIKYLTDSFKTEQGWKYNYKTLSKGTLNSHEDNVFRFNSTILQRIKIHIENRDNQPLSIDGIEVMGYLYSLSVRFSEPATYYLTYGRLNDKKPQYDIDRFTDNIPLELNSLKFDEEQTIKNEEIPVSKALFQNMTWLWIIMAAIILLLGWFSFRMIRDN